MIHPRTIIFSGSAQTVAAGRLLAQLCNRLGWQVYGRPLHHATAQFPSYGISIADRPLTELCLPAQLLVSLDNNGWTYHAGQLATESLAVIPDNSQKPKRLKIPTVALPFQAVARQTANHPQADIGVALGVAAAALGLPVAKLLTLLQSIDNEAFQSSAIIAGFQTLQHSYPYLELPKTTATKPAGTVVDGGQALALGMVAGGAKYITHTAHPLLNSLTQILNRFSDSGLVIEQVFDPATAASQAVGAAIAGVRSIVISSQLAGMASSYTMSLISETPMVAIQLLADQSELPAALSQASIMSPVVISPATPQQCFSCIQEALNLAELFQTSVTILVNPIVVETCQTTPDLAGQVLPINRGSLIKAKQAESDLRFERYQFTTNHISPRKVLGQPGPAFTTSVVEHGPSGEPDTAIINQRRMLHKRQHKLDPLFRHVLPYQLYGPTRAKISIICHGSVVGAACQAMEQLNHSAALVNVVQLIYLNPFPADQLQPLFHQHRHLFVLEPGLTAQLTQLINHNAKMAVHHYAVSSPEGIHVEEIIAEIKKQLGYIPIMP